MKTLVWALLLPAMSFGQSDLETAIRGGEILLTGLTAFKLAKTDPHATTILTLCVKNKLEGKITYTIVGIDSEENEIRKELVIPKSGKECLYDLPKGVYTYEIQLEDGTIYKKAECKLDREDTIVLKED